MFRDYQGACVYINQTCCSREIIYLLHMLQWFYNMIQDQKIYYSDPFSGTIYSN